MLKPFAPTALEKIGNEWVNVTTICQDKFGRLPKESSILASKMDTEAYPEPCQATKMERFAKVASDCKPLTILEKGSFLDVW